MTARLRPWLLLCLGALAGGAAMAAPVQVDPAFGYRIGDSVVAIGRVAVDERAQLDPESLPRTGPVNGWLALQEVQVVAERGTRQIIRTFQVTASATEPKLLFLPKAQLKFRLGARELAEQLESVPISVSPLTSTEPILRSGFGALRPDRDVPDPEAGEALRRAWWLLATLAALALLWFGVRSLALRRPGFAPFAMAARKLRRIARAQAGRAAHRSRDDPQAVRQAFRIMHDAFNQAAGQAVFASQNDRFLVEHPRFAAEAASVRLFFERSEEVFFGGHATAPGSPGRPAAQRARAELTWLADLARRLARLEQPGR